MKENPTIAHAPLPLARPNFHRHAAHSLHCPVGVADQLAVIAWPLLAGRSLADRCDAVAR